jgi:hypothetical protein
MPKLCFILDESAPWPAELTESEPASLRLKAFLQRVQTEKGIPDVRGSLYGLVALSATPNTSLHADAGRGEVFF